MTRGLLPLRRNVVIFDPKGDDSTLDRYGGRRVRSMPSRLDVFLHAEPETGIRYRLNPPYAGAKSAFDEAIRAVWRTSKKMEQGPGREGWTVYIDELRIASDKLGLRSHLETLWIAGRSRGITVIAGTQAPRFVPSEFYDQPRYLAIGAIRDRRALVRLSEIGGDTDMMMDVVPRLRQREFLFVSPDWSARTRYSARR